MHGHNSSITKIRRFHEQWTQTLTPKMQQKNINNNNNNNKPTRTGTEILVAMIPWMCKVDVCVQQNKMAKDKIRLVTSHLSLD